MKTSSQFHFYSPQSQTIPPRFTSTLCLPALKFHPFLALILRSALWIQDFGGSIRVKDDKHLNNKYSVLATPSLKLCCTKRPHLRHKFTCQEDKPYVRLFCWSVKCLSCSRCFVNKDIFSQCLWISCPLSLSTQGLRMWLQTHIQRTQTDCEKG